MKNNLKSTIAWYDKHAEEYATVSQKYAPLDEIEEFCAYLPQGGSILDVGCGPGRDAGIFHNKGFKVTGLDLSSGLIKIAKEKYPQINFIKGNFLQLPCENVSFDGIWAHAALVHLEKISQINRAICEFHRVLKPGGIVHIVVKVSGSKEKEGEQRKFHYFSQNDWHLFLEMNGFLIEKLVTFWDYEKYPERKLEVKWIYALGKKI